MLHIHRNWEFLMARKRSNSLFIVLNVVVSLAVAGIVIFLYRSLPQTEEPERARPTFIVVYSPTPDPRLLPAEMLQGTVDAQGGTMAALQREATAISLVVTQQAELLAANTGGDQGASIAGSGEAGTVPTQQRQPQSDLPTINPSLIPPLPTHIGGGGANVSGEDASPIPEDGCQRYFVQSGDTASTIATRFEVSLSELFILNGINDQTILQIGDELLIPSPECEPEIPPTATPSPQPTFNLTIVAPTATLPIIAEESQVQIVNILNPGDITAEQVEIENQGGEINLFGWTLSDGQGNIYTFPDVRLVPSGIIRISTRAGTNTPGFLYWNQNSPVWEIGEVATLSNAAGIIQSTFEVGGEVIEFGDIGN
jgi:LysM repeat protein